MDVAYAHASGEYLLIVGLTMSLLTRYPEDIVRGLKTVLPPSMRLLWTPLPLEASPIKDHDAPGPIPTTPSTNSSDENAHSIPNAPILYVGRESLALTNLLMTHSLCDVSSNSFLTRSIAERRPRYTRTIR